MKDYLAEVNRLEEAISANHPCDARMYGLELCELVREALKPVDIGAAIEDLAKQMRADFANPPSWQNAVMDKATQGSKGWLKKHWYEQGSEEQPPEDVTHVRDRDGEHWWRFESPHGGDGWHCTGSIDMPPSPEGADLNLWRYVSQHGPFEVGRPKESYAHVEYTINNPPPNTVSILVDLSSGETIHRVPGTSRWRASGWDDYDVKTEGYDPFEHLFRTLSGPFRMYTGESITKNMTPNLEWEQGEDEDPPHDSFRAVVGTSPSGSLQTFWRDPDGRGWLKKQSVAMPDRFPADELIGWENLLENCRSVKEFRPGVAP